MSANFNFTSDADLIGDFVTGDRPVARTPAAEVQVVQAILICTPRIWMLWPPLAKRWMR
jgi:hypothetical protein